MSTTINTQEAGGGISACIREFLAREILFCDAAFPYDDDASLLGTGIIDSLGVLELVEFASKRYKIAVHALELKPENFDSVNKFAAFIQRKLENAVE